MANRIKKLNYFYFIIIVLTQFSCFDSPDEFISPVWDAEINIPITSKQFELLEIVEKDSSMLQSSEDVTTLGLIYFSDIQNISSFTIEDELKNDGFETGFSHKIGQIKVSIPIPAASEIRVEDWTTEVTSGSFQVFPEQEGNVSIDVSGVESVEAIQVDSGELLLLIVNRLPVEIVLRGLSIKNQIDGSIIAQKQSFDPNQWVEIPPLSIDTVKFPLIDKVVTNSLQYEGTIWSQGSNGVEVQIPEEAGTTILALFQNLVIGSATAQLPQQNFGFDGGIVFDDSTMIEEAIIEEGSGTITLNNNMDLNVTVDIIFRNFYDDNDQPYQLTTYLYRNEKNRIIPLTSLSGWKIASAIPGIETNEILYSISAITDSTGEVSTITKNDSVSFNVQFDQLVLRYFKGRLKPTYANLEQSEFKLDYGNINDGLSFGEVNFRDAYFELNLHSPSDLNLKIVGELIGNNGINSLSKQIDIIIPSFEPVEIDISDLINEFTEVLPDSFSLDGRVLLNPFYESVTVERDDSIFGEIEFEIPFDVGVTAGSFKDTFEVDIGDIDEENIDRLNYGEIIFQITNSVPVALIVTSAILDSNYNKVLDIPTPNNTNSYIEVPKPSVSSNGEILAVESVTQTLVVVGDDIQKLLNNPYMMLEIMFSTAGENNDPVKFKTTNKISIDVGVKAEYRVEL